MSPLRYSESYTVEDWTKDVRAEEHSRRFEEIEKTRSEKREESWRMIEVQPY